MNETETDKAFTSITYEQRKLIQKLLDKGVSFNDVCLKAGIKRHALYYERLRMGSLDTPYNADVAQQDKENREKVKRAKPIGETKNFPNLISRCHHNLKQYLADPKIETIYEAIEILESLGADPDRKVNNTTAQEREKIIDLWQQGLTYGQIAGILGRARSTVTLVIHKAAGNTETNRAHELTAETIKHKWAPITKEDKE